MRRPGEQCREPLNLRVQYACMHPSRQAGRVLTAPDSIRCAPMTGGTPSAQRDLGITLMP